MAVVVCPQCGVPHDEPRWLEDTHQWCVQGELEHTWGNSSGGSGGGGGGDDAGGGGGDHEKVNEGGMKRGRPEQLQPSGFDITPDPAPRREIPSNGQYKRKRPAKRKEMHDRPGTPELVSTDDAKEADPTAERMNESFNSSDSDDTTANEKESSGRGIIHSHRRSASLGRGVLGSENGSVRGSGGGRQRGRGRRGERVGHGRGGRIGAGGGRGGWGGRGVGRGCGDGRSSRDISSDFAAGEAAWIQYFAESKTDMKAALALQGQAGGDSNGWIEPCDELVSTKEMDVQYDNVWCVAVRISATPIIPPNQPHLC